MSLPSWAMKLLPHEPPFRFVSELTEYVPGICLRTMHTFPHLQAKGMGGGDLIPEVCLVEGLAQSAILLTQLETTPLQKWEFPLLGRVQASMCASVAWGMKVEYEVRIIRILAKQAVLSGTVYAGGVGRLLEASLAVAVADGRGG